MNFVISSTELFNCLQAVGKVIASKNTLPILDDFLFEIKGNDLTITASDLETTLISTLKLENISGKGKIALEAKRLMEIMKEFPEQPLTIEIDTDSFSVDIISENGKFSIKGQDAEDFPNYAKLSKSKSSSVTLNPEILLSALNRTLFATAEDELRPVMNGVYFDFTSDVTTFVASDAHKLVRYSRTDAKSGIQSSFILPKKPASILKSILGKEEQDVVIEFDEQNAFFTLSKYKLICRLTEGKYPNYSSVIPKDNPYKMIIDRVEFYNTLKRVSIFANQASNLVKLELSGNQLTVSAQDIDYSISAYERINCQYEGDKIEIGFKSKFLLEILQNLPSTDVVMELSDPSHAGLIIPHDKEIEAEDILMLLMPMMLS